MVAVKMKIINKNMKEEKINEENLDEKFNIGIEEIKNIRLTTLEKTNILKNILNTPVSSIREPVKSPWTFYSFVSRLHKNHLVYYVSVSCLVVIFGTSVVFASGGSLPGNILYSLKVSVLEPIHSSLKFTVEAKAKYESTLAIERLKEAEILAEKGELDAPKEKQLGMLLSGHTTALNKNLAELRQDQSKTEEFSDDIITSFQAEMNAHAKVLDFIVGSVATNDSSVNTMSTTSTANTLEIRQDTNTKISNTARENGEKLRENFKKNDDIKMKSETSEEDKEEKESKKQNKYTTKKDKIESLIDLTTTSLIDTSTGISPRDEKEQIIIENTNKTLWEARQHLKEAEKEDEEGDEDNAYSKLLDSESSAKEAEILLKAGLKLQNRK
jgi:hypothetical protein